MGRKPVKYASVKECNGGDEGSTTVTATSAVGRDGFVWIGPGEPLKPKRRNGRLAWKPRALAAESAAQVYLWVGLFLVVVSFVVGVNVGLYGF